MEDHTKSTTFFVYKRSQCLYLSAKLFDGSSSSSDAISSNKSKKEPVQSQQFLVKEIVIQRHVRQLFYYSSRNMKKPLRSQQTISCKRDCDSETGLFSSISPSLYIVFFCKLFYSILILLSIC